MTKMRKPPGIGKESNSNRKKSSKDRWTSEIVSLALGGLTTGLYISTLYPSVPGGDSGELITAAYELGVAHPPGYPLFTILAHCMIRLVPNGSIAWRVNLLTAIFGGFTAMFLSQLVIRLTGSLSCGLFAVGTFCWCHLTWMWSITSEVFSLNNLFIVIIMKLSIDFYYAEEHMKLKISLYGALMCGLSLCNQHTIVIYNVVLIVWVLMELYWKKVLSFTHLFKLGLMFTLGLVPYIYLPLSSHFSQACWTWGDQKTMSGFMKHLLRSEYGTFDLGKGGVQQDVLWSLWLYAVHVTKEMTFLTTFLFLVGTYLSIDRFVKLREKICTVFLLMMFVYTSFFSWRANLDTSNPLMYGVVERFWMQSDIVVIVIAAVALDSFSRLIDARLHFAKKINVGAILVTATTIFQLQRNYAVCNQSNNTAILEFGKNVINSLPKESLVLTKGDLPSNTLRYLYLCENMRPDLSLFDQEVLTYDWSVPMMKKSYPGIVFPGDHLYTLDTIMPDGKTAFTFTSFLIANSRRSMFGCIGVQDHENSWQEHYEVIPHGVCSQFIVKGSSVNLSRYVKETKKIADNWTYPYNGFDDSSWERVATNEMWHAKISSAFQLFLMADETMSSDLKTDYITASYKLYNAAMKKNKEFPAYWHKNYALVCERMTRIKSKYRAKDLVEEIVKHFELFMEKEPTDNEIEAIKSTAASMKRILENAQKGL